MSGSLPCPSAHVVVIVTTGKLEEEMSGEVMTRRFGAENDCRIAARRRKGPASGLALRAPLPRRSGMRRSGWVFPNNREDET